MRRSIHGRGLDLGAAPLWIPSPERVEATGLARFAASLSARGHAVGDDYRALWRWSIENQSAFWDAVWDWCGVVGHKGGRAMEPGDRLPDARYFPDARLNFAENLLRKRSGAPAIIARNESGRHRELSWRELSDLASRLARAMRAAGLNPGDRIALLLPNIPEAVAVALAAASIGAVVSSASPDFGARGVVDRFGQVDPRLLFVADGYGYRGRRHNTLAKVPRILEGLPSVERTVVVPNLEEAASRTAAGAVAFRDFIAPHPPADIEFARLPFDHPLYILFSSGTTGAPKCIVHRAGGVLVQHLKEHRLHCDVRPGDRVFHYTTLGWMMWNWLVSALASEATILLYDGSPAHPAATSLLDFAEDTGMTLMGTSPGHLDALRTSGASPRRTHDLSSLRTIVSTGSPLPANAFEYVYRHVRRDVHLASVSGGTDLCACFVGGVPTLPVHPGEIQGPALGMAVDVFDADGAPLGAGKGELVCTRPFPSLPLGFLNDDGSRYRDAYFDRFPDVWRHGDYIERTATGGYVIHGRSDATLNVRGVRIGTAEVYRPVEAMDEVAEALAIAQRRGDDTRMVLFVRLAGGARLDAALRRRIRAVLRSEASPRHVPARIVQVGDVPRTRSGKIVELAVRAVVHGEPVPNVGALANPEALEEFRGRV